MNHDIKSTQPEFDRMASGAQTFQLRKNDRNYAIGDTLTLREWNPRTSKYTDRAVTVRVTHAIEGDGILLSKNRILMSTSLVGVDDPPQERKRLARRRFKKGEVLEIERSKLRIRIKEVDGAGQATEIELAD